MVCVMSFCPAGFKRVDRLCTVCKRLKSKTLTCQENVPKQITNHLRISPAIDSGAMFKTFYSTSLDLF